jgi:hypothetical protein
MEIKDVDALAQRLTATYDKMDPLKQELKALEDTALELEQKLSEALVEAGKDVWNIDGYKPLRLKVKTNWNVKDVEKCLANLKPEMLAVGRLGQAINTWANAEAENGVDVKSLLGIESYERASITGGQKI